MGFTYMVPAYFKQRAIQYLRQEISASDLVQAFEQCEYEYDDLGNAYYAGMRHTPWDSHAVDLSFFGPSECVHILDKNRKLVESAVKKALHTTETGFILHKLFFLEDDISGNTNFKSNEERINADLEMARCVLNDLIKAGERLSVNPMYTRKTPEDNINDWIRDALSFIGYSETKDQTRHGLSSSGSSSGEVDILLCKDRREVAIIEGLKLTNIDRSYIDRHIIKSIINYNPLGTAVFIVVYVSTNDFATFWERSLTYLREYDYRMQVKRPLTNEPNPNAASRVAFAVLSRDGYDFPFYFVAIKLMK